MSEPVRLGNVLPDVMERIRKRCNEYRKQHGLPLLEEELGYKLMEAGRA